MSAHTQTVRTVVVIDRELPKGLAANAAAVLALTLGARGPALIGTDFEDAAGATHLGLIPTGFPVLGADAAELVGLRAAALARDLFVADLPRAGQETTDYEAFRAAVAATAPEALAYLAVLVSGETKAVRKVTGRFALLG